MFGLFDFSGCGWKAHFWLQYGWDTSYIWTKISTQASSVSSVWVCLIHPVLSTSVLVSAVQIPIAPHRQECLDVLKEGAVVSRSLAFQKNSTWVNEKGAELEEAELKKMRKLEKAGIKVLPASVQYNRSAVECMCMQRLKLLTSCV